MKRDPRLEAFGRLIEAWRIEDGLEQRGQLAAALQATDLLGRPVRSGQDVERLIDRIRKWERNGAWPNKREAAALRRALRADPDDPDAARVRQERVERWNELHPETGDYYSSLLRREADKLASEVFQGAASEEAPSVRESRHYLEAIHLIKLVDDIRRGEPPHITMEAMRAMDDSMHSLRGIEHAIGEQVAHHMIEAIARQLHEEKDEDRRRCLIEDGFIISRRLRGLQRAADVCSSIDDEDPVRAAAAVIKAGAFCLDPGKEYTEEYESEIWPLMIASLKKMDRSDVACELSAYFIFMYSKSYLLNKRASFVGKFLHDIYDDGCMGFISEASFPPLATFWLGASLGKYRQIAADQAKYYLEDWARLADGKVDRSEIEPPPDYLAKAYKRIGGEDQISARLIVRFQASNSKYVRCGIALLLARAGAPRPEFRNAWIRMLADRRMGRWMVLEVLGYLVHWHPEHAARLLSAMLVRGERQETGRTGRAPPVDRRVAFLALLGSGDFGTLRELFRSARGADGYSPGAVAHAVASGGSWEVFSIFRLPWWRSWEHARGVLWAFWQAYARLYYRLPVHLVRQAIGSGKS